MSFSASKCSSISITRKTKKIVHNYTFHNQVLDRVSCATYLGMELSSNLTWAAHIDKTTAKGNRQLGFLKRNLPINCAKVKETTYKGLVRPIMEYCAPVWDTSHVEKVQTPARDGATMCSTFHAGTVPLRQPCLRYACSVTMGDSRTLPVEVPPHYVLQNPI